MLPRNALGFVLIAIGLISCQKQQAAAPDEKTSVRAVDAQFSDYRQSVTLTGEVVAHVESNLSFRVGGQITEWLVDVGSHVKAGQVLARIDPKQQQADVDTAQATVEAAEADLNQSTLEFTRRSALLASGSTSKESYDQAQTAKATAESSLESAKAQLGRAHDALSYTELKADSDGIVTARDVEVGQVVQAAQTAFTVAVDGPRDAVFHIYESLLLGKSGRPRVQVSLVSNPDVTAEGAVSEVSPSIDSSTGTVRVKIALDSTPPEMQLGAAVTGVAQSSADKLLILPWTSLSTVDGKPAVWIVDPKDNSVDLRPITIKSYETGGRMAISDGVKAGDLVVVDGGKLLHPGQVVDVVKEQG